jgi:hypothetical protein
VRGRQVWMWMAGVLIALAVPASANAEVLLNQIDETSPQSINSQDFNAANDEFDAMTADDFVVPGGETWQIDSALVRGNNSGTTAATSANVKIFADAGGLPGAEVFSGVATATDYPRMQLSFAGPTLTAGTYWFGVSAILDPGASAPFSQWFWAENSEPFGSPAVYRNPGDGFNTGCVTFTLKSACPFGSEQHPAPSQSFSLSGTRTLPPPLSNEACEQAQANLEKAKAKLKKLKQKDAARAKIKKAKAKVRKAKAAVKEAC